MKVITLFTTVLFSVLLTSAAFGQIQVTASPGTLSSAMIPGNMYGRFDYGTVWVGSMNTAFFNLTNTSNQFLRFSNSYTFGIGFNDYHNCYGGLMPYQTCTVRVQYWPNFAGFHSGQTNLSFYDTRGFLSTLRIDLVGRAVNR